MAAKNRAKKNRLPAVRPMLAVLSAQLPVQEAAYGFEVKWDGYRALAYWDGRTLRVESRNQQDLTGKLNDLAATAEKVFGRKSCILDGELVALDRKGHPSFDRLQQAMGWRHPESGNIPILFVAFDVLFIDGRWLGEEPLVHRRKILESAVKENRSWKLSPWAAGKGKQMLKTARQHGLEGVMAKRLDSAYYPGERSDAWLKIKLRKRQEFVVAGWTPGKGTAESGIGSLLLGYYGGRPRQLHYAGNVGTGFRESERRTLWEHLKTRQRRVSPFQEPVEDRAAHFVIPELVAEIEFTSWTAQRKVRQASFLGFRKDKRPEEVTADPA